MSDQKDTHLTFEGMQNSVADDIRLLNEAKARLLQVRELQGSDIRALVGSIGHEIAVREYHIREQARYFENLKEVK